MEKRYIVLGFGIVVAVGQMMAPIPLFVGLPLLVLGLWFIAWGMLGKPFQRKVAALAPPLSVAMRGIDTMLESFSSQGGPSDRNAEFDRQKRTIAKNILAECLAKGSGLFSQGKTTEDQNFPHLVDAWVADTRNTIRSHFGRAEEQLFLNHFGLTFYASGGQFARSQTCLEGCIRRLNSLIERCDEIHIE
jgi:hypothetical protein